MLHHKNSIAFLLFFLLFGTYATGQFNVGFSAGLVSSQVSGDGVHGFNQFGVRAGALSRTTFSENWGLDIGIFYTQKGSRQWASKGSISTYRLRIHCIDVPLLANYYWKDFCFQLGLSGNTYIGKKEQDNFGPIQAQRSFKRFALSADAFVSYFFTDHFWVGLHFSNSLTPIRPHKAGQSYQLNLGQYNTLLSLDVGYLLKPFN